jgi:hypothetical protein
MTKPERPRDNSLWTRIMHQVIASCTATRARRLPLAEPLLRERNLRRLSSPVHQYVLHIAQHMSSAIVMVGEYLVLLMHAARAQDVRPLSCALSQMCAIRAVHRRGSKGSSRRRRRRGGRVPRGSRHTCCRTRRPVWDAVELAARKGLQGQCDDTPAKHRIGRVYLLAELGWVVHREAIHEVKPDDGAVCRKVECKFNLEEDSKEPRANQRPHGRHIWLRSVA